MALLPKGRAGGSAIRQNQVDPTVLLALVLDLGDFHAADLRRVPDMGPAAGLKIDGRALRPDADETHPAAGGRRLPRHGPHQVGPWGGRPAARRVGTEGV